MFDCTSSWPLPEITSTSGGVQRLPGPFRSQHICNVKYLEKFGFAHQWVTFVTQLCTVITDIEPIIIRALFSPFREMEHGLSDSCRKWNLIWTRCPAGVSFPPSVATCPHFVLVVLNVCLWCSVFSLLTTNATGKIVILCRVHETRPKNALCIERRNLESCAWC